MSIDVTDSTSNFTSGYNGTEEEEVPSGSYQTYIYIAIGVLGILDNGFVVAILCSSKNLRRKTTNILIINQSLLDCSISILLVANAEASLGAARGHYGLAGQLFCRLWANRLILWSLFMSSTYNLVALTIERYLELVHPIKHKTSFKSYHMALAIIFVWLIGPLYCLPLGIPTSAAKDGRCLNVSIWSHVWLRVFFGCITVILQYFLPIAIMVFCYTKIAMALRPRIQPSTSNVVSQADQSRQAKQTKARRNVILTLVIVTACFILCWTGNQMYLFLFNCGYPFTFTDAFYTFTIYAAFANSCVNPVIYCVKYEMFKRQARRIICKMKPGEETDASITQTVS